MFKLKLILPVVLLVVVGAFVLYAMKQAEATPPAVNVTIVASDFKYEPATITVKSGQRVHVTFKNAGAVMHETDSKDLRDGTKSEPGKLP